MQKTIGRPHQSSVVQKTAPKNTKFEKREHFQNGRNWPRCMGYSPCKMVSLGQKLKTDKRCNKQLCDNIKNLVCKKPLQKTPNSRKMRAISKWPKLATMYGLQPMQNSQFGSKIKNSQKMQKTIGRPYQSSVVQKTASKNT